MTAGFPDIEVAFRESEVTRSVVGPKLLSPKPLLDPIPEFRKPFTPMLGLSIAPLKTPHYEGTGALYFRLSKDDDHIILLTAAHVARPPHMYTNKDMSRKSNSGPRENIVTLGNMGYRHSTNAMIATIGHLARSVMMCERVNTRLGEFVDGEDPEVTRRRDGNEYEVKKATRIIDHLNKLHDQVTKRTTNPDHCIIGFVLHAEPIVVSDGPNRFTRDWAFIELYKEKIDWDTFPGNKVYVGSFPISSHIFSFG